MTILVLFWLFETHNAHIYLITSQLYRNFSFILMNCASPNIININIQISVIKMNTIINTNIVHLLVGHSKTVNKWKALNVHFQITHCLNKTQCLKFSRHFSLHSKSENGAQHNHSQSKPNDVEHNWDERSFGPIRDHSGWSYPVM